MNSTELWLKFWFAHNEQVILWVFAGFLLAVTVVTINAIFAKPEDEQASGSSFKDLENSLKKVLDERPAASTSAPTPAIQVGDLDGDLVPAPMVAAIREELESKKAELQKVQADVQAKAAEIEIVKKQHADATAQLQTMASGGGGASTEEVTALKNRVGELESKLSEYTVIEDDIADLSMYKEENSRLKAELEALKASGATPSAAPAAPAAVPAATPVAAPAAAVEAAPEAPVASAPIAESPIAEDDPIMAEFAAAVAEQQQMTELNNAAAKKKEAAIIDDAENGQLDTDKMLAEMADLSNMPTEEDAGGAHILEAEPDTDKMTAEAEALDQSTKAS